MSKSTNTALGRLLYSVMFLALALLLPFLTERIPEIGYQLYPMHFLVIICGFVCGPKWGMAVGIAAPFLRAFLFDSFSYMPDAVVMACELATYAFIAGLLYKKLDKNLFMYYVELVTAMVCGRLVWGVVMFIFILLGEANGEIGFYLIWNRTVLQRIPAIILQLAAIPAIVNVFKKNRLILN